MPQVDERETSVGEATGEERGVGGPAGGFLPGEHVVVREMEDESNWRVVAPLSYTAQRQTFRVPMEMMTDFASVPRPLVWFLPRYGRYTKAAIVHDYLWRTAVPGHLVTRREADAIFRRAMRELKVAFLRRWLMWAAVRWGSLSKKDGRAGWWRDAWRVIPLTLLALPIVVPPALLVLLALLVFYVVELVVWVPLEISRVVRTRKTKEPPRKQVNKPSLLLKL